MLIAIEDPKYLVGDVVIIDKAIHHYQKVNNDIKYIPAAKSIEKLCAILEHRPEGWILVQFADGKFDCVKTSTITQFVWHLDKNELFKFPNLEMEQ